MLNFPLLNTINSPEDLKKLSEQQLEQLAQEIRQFMISVISKTGGHLAPNLGVVELTLALHRVFSTPEDKIVFDVGHQAYIHKIITGRREQFPTLRQYGGLSGFPKRCESEHDAFGTGHSSTSISAALGMAVARDLQGEDYNVIAVIGDGSMTGGMAFEGLNNAGDLHKRMIVVLNDNEMSISKNVGAMSEYLYQLRTGETYNKIKSDIEGWLKNMEFGTDVLKAVRRLKGSVKYLMVPSSIFEELGYTYLGPIDGHDLNALQDVFQAAKKIHSGRGGAAAGLLRAGGRRLRADALHLLLRRRHGRVLLHHLRQRTRLRRGHAPGGAGRRGADLLPAGRCMAGAAPELSRITRTDPRTAPTRGCPRSAGGWFCRSRRSGSPGRLRHQ